jgi:hypothetical protein
VLDVLVLLVFLDLLLAADGERVILDVISTSLRSSPGISALTSIALSVSEISMLGTIFFAPSGPTPCANSLNSRSISRCRPNNPKPDGTNALSSRDGTSDLNLMGFSFFSLRTCCWVRATW